MDWSSPRHTQHLSSQSVATYFSQKQPPPAFHSHKPPAPTTVHLSISASVVTAFGDTAVVVGSVAQLGGWDPSRGLRLTTDADSYPTWTGNVPIDCASLGECECEPVVEFCRGASRPALFHAVAVGWR